MSFCVLSMFFEAVIFAFRWLLTCPPSQCCLQTPAGLGSFSQCGVSDEGRRSEHLPLFSQALSLFLSLVVGRSDCLRAHQRSLKVVDAPGLALDNRGLLLMSGVQFVPVSFRVFELGLLLGDSVLAGCCIFAKLP